MPYIPPEIVARILSYVGDWELATALGVQHVVPKTAPWLEQATEMDHAILTGNLSIVRATDERLAARRALCYPENVTLNQLACMSNPRSSPPSNPPFSTRPTFTDWGCRVMVRFGYVDLLEYFRQNHPRHLDYHCRFLLPTVASAWGRIQVLEWARQKKFPIGITSEAMDEASRHGHVDVLEWWRSAPGLPSPRYSENALSSATVKGQVSVLEWWKNSGLPLKIGNILDFASMTDGGAAGSAEMLEWWSRSGLPCKYTTRSLYYLSSRGHVKLLDWWLHSGYQLYYDRGVLTAATRRGQIASLEWWLNSGLQVTFSFFDIDEALEDAIVNANSTREWWSKHGFDPNMSDDEWMRERELC